jgi:hypothetical protein
MTDDDMLFLDEGGEGKFLKYVENTEVFGVKRLQTTLKIELCQKSGALKCEVTVGCETPNMSLN